MQGLAGLLAAHPLGRLVAQQSTLAAHKGAQVTVRAADNQLSFGDGHNPAALGAIETVGAFRVAHIFAATQAASRNNTGAAIRPAPAHKPKPAAHSNNSKWNVF